MLKTVARSTNRTLWRGVLASIVFGFGIPSQFELVIAGQIECLHVDTPNILTCDHRVPHISFVPANRGELVELFVRERVKDSGKEPPKVVLMITGRSVPVLPGFELRTDHYDWALWLAQAGGFDVFMLDFQGSGRSPRPKMDDPCNVPKDQQQSILIPNPLSATCDLKYPFQLINSQSDWSELDTVVDYIRNLRGVDKVALVSWSQGSFRIGPYAVQHPDKVDSLLMYAPIYNPAGRAGTGSDGFAPPVTLPQPGTPMTLTMRSGLIGDRMFGTGLWGSEIQQEDLAQCGNQVEEGIQDVVWNAIMANDELGSNWGPPPAGAPAGSPPEGVMRVRSPFLWGWNSSTASRIAVPALIIYGEFDTTALIPPQTTNASPLLYDAISQSNKLLFKVQCAGHFMVWERQRRVLHHISKEWLKHGAVEGFTNGSFFVDTEGNLIAQ